MTTQRSQRPTVALLSNRIKTGMQAISGLASMNARSQSEYWLIALDCSNAESSVAEQLVAHVNGEVLAAKEPLQHCCERVK